MQAQAHRLMSSVKQEFLGRIPFPRVADEPVNVIRVRRSGRRGWTASCECGQAERHGDPDSAWAWTAAHACPDS